MNDSKFCAVPFGAFGTHKHTHREGERHCAPAITNISCVRVLFNHYYVFTKCTNNFFVRLQVSFSLTLRSSFVRILANHKLCQN